MGVKQGCKLSPTLFALYINDLAEDIRNLDCGIDLDVGQLSLLFYEDDVMLLAPSETSLQNMLNVLNDWCKNGGLQLTKIKLKLKIFVLIQWIDAKQNLHALISI